AARLAGPRGLQIAAALSTANHGVSWTTRTYLFDQLIAAEIDRGVDVVVNLGAGLDTRPYRMKLPPSLIWVEADAPEIIDYKEDLLGVEPPNCVLERFRLDLREAKARRAFLKECSRKGTNVLVVTEGVLIYLETREVANLASDLLAEKPFKRWI